jgi:hypothetical protein
MAGVGSRVGVSDGEDAVNFALVCLYESRVDWPTALTCNPSHQGFVRLGGGKPFWHSC